VFENFTSEQIANNQL